MNGHLQPQATTPLHPELERRITVSITITDRLAAASGALGTALVFAGLVLANTATAEISNSDPAASIAYAFDTNRTEIRRGVTLALGGVFLVLWYLGWLRGRVRTAEGKDGWLGAVLFGGGLVGVAGIVGYLGALVAATNSTIISAPESAQTLLLATWELGGLIGPAFGALVGAASLASIRYRLLPQFAQPLAWLGLPLALGLGLSGFLGGALVMLALVWLFAFAVGQLASPSLQSAATKLAPAGQPG